MRLILTAVLLVPFITPGFAQDEKPDCTDPQDQSTMTYCAGVDFDKADKDLNALWPEIKKAAQEDDANVGNGTHEYLDALMASQRAWLAYRDAECTWQGFYAHGGSMEPMLVNACLAKLTEERVKALKDGQEQ